MRMSRRGSARAWRHRSWSGTTSALRSPLSSTGSAASKPTSRTAAMQTQAHSACACRSSSRVWTQWQLHATRLPSRSRQRRWRGERVPWTVSCSSPAASAPFAPFLGMMIRLSF